MARPSPPCTMPRSPPASPRCSPASSLPRCRGRCRCRPQTLPATLRHSGADGFRDAVSLSRAWHGGAAEPAGPERRDQLGRRSAPLDRMGPPVRRPVRDDGAGHGRLCQAHHLPRHRPGAGVGFAGLADRAERTTSASSRRRQSRWRDRRGELLISARRHHAGAAGGGWAPLRADRADGDGGAGRRPRRVGLASVHSRRQPGRGPLSACSTATRRCPG